MTQFSFLQWQVHSTGHIDVAAKFREFQIVPDLPIEPPTEACNVSTLNHHPILPALRTTRSIYPMSWNNQTPHHHVTSHSLFHIPGHVFQRHRKFRQRINPYTSKRSSKCQMERWSQFHLRRLHARYVYSLALIANKPLIQVSKSHADLDSPNRTHPTEREWQHWFVANIRGDRVDLAETLSGYLGAMPIEHTGKSNSVRGSNYTNISANSSILFRAPPLRIPSLQTTRLYQLRPHDMARRSVSSSRWIFISSRTLVTTLFVTDRKTDVLISRSPNSRNPTNSETQSPVTSFKPNGTTGCRTCGYKWKIGKENGNAVHSLRKFSVLVPSLLQF